MILDGNLHLYKGIKSTGIGNHLGNYTRLFPIVYIVSKDNYLIQIVNMYLMYYI